jgi:hypothetical protein
VVYRINLSRLTYFKRFWRCFTIIMPFFLLGISPVLSQPNLLTPVKMKIEDGNFDGVSVVIKNNTTGETHSIAGSAKLNLNLKINCDYVISFSKPGYITKKISLNTKAPGERAKQGFHEFPFEVNLFKQYDGVNIVVFNQPVGKISYNRLIDDFDYDTDYTKQIQSALKAAEEEIKQKQIEEKVLAENKKQEEVKNKAEEEAKKKADAKAKSDADKKAAEEAKAQAAEKAKAKKEEEEQAKRDLLAKQEEEKRQKALAKMEEEERAKAKAYEEEEARKKASASGGTDTRPTNVSGGGQDQLASNPSKGSGEEHLNAKPGKGSGSDKPSVAKAKPVSNEEKSGGKAPAIKGQEERPTPAPVITQTATPEKTPENYEVAPEISVEEISEPNRTVTKVTIRKPPKNFIYTRVVYKWGGVFFFKDNMSISQSMFADATGLK